ncbi:N-acetylglucosamine kinase [Actinomadura sp. HBU206391]|uniref:N-acetylglucosamine kinase n=1 Tax=Actinomadura sp. HBU206391 TaxID=2731692 RepID=UPI00164FF974|nr:BadF/BadG/BcrA/BcrD ATPase family protein [Actinomadura sp. HBU206391]MBC6462543.1 N-acetylglucosamine kinase [Actinomadura sp. HBU206391]
MFLGVDGGGTKTAFCLVTESGEVSAQVRAPSTYYFSVGIDLVGRVLRDGIAAVCAEAGTTPEGIRHAFFGLPTYGEVSGDIPTLNAAARDALGHDRYACGNDMVCSWAGSLGGADGINILSGTGSMTYGEFGGRGARVGGWGELFGDEGSAYWIAIRGLSCFSKMSDGRLPPGPLHTLIGEHLGLKEDLDLVDVVLNRWQGDRSKIAALSRLVVTAADRGDRYGRDILAQAARELAITVDTTRERLGFRPGQSVPVSYSGGVFKAGPSILDAFRSELEGRYATYELRDPLYPPHIGAAIYAAKLSANPLSHAALQRLQSAPSTSLGEDDEKQ